MMVIYLAFRAIFTPIQMREECMNTSENFLMLDSVGVTCGKTYTRMAKNAIIIDVGSLYRGLSPILLRKINKYFPYP